MHGPVVNRGSITKGASSGTIRTDSVGVYNLGTWSYITLQLYGGAAGDRHTLAVLANNPFSNANSTTNGYLELVGCAALPGTTTFQATNLLINDPSKITVSVPSGTPVIAGSGALEITGGSTGLSFGITPDAQLGQLKYLVYTSTGPQSVNISDNGGMTVGELRLTGGTKLFENSRTVTGQLVISPFTALENGSGGSRTLTVVGSVRSYGTVANYDGSKHLTVQVSGDLQNSGIWNAYVTELTGSAARRVNGGFPLGGTTKIPAPFELAGSARFGALTLGAGGAYASLTFPASLPLPRIEATGTLSGQGGVHRGKLLINNAGDQQIQANLVADRIEISGSGLKRVYRQTFIGDLIVQPGATSLPGPMSGASSTSTAASPITVLSATAPTTPPITATSTCMSPRTASTATKPARAGPIPAPRSTGRRFPTPRPTSLISAQTSRTGRRTPRAARLRRSPRCSPQPILVPN